MITKQTRNTLFCFQLILQCLAVNEINRPSKTTTMVRSRLNTTQRKKACTSYSSSTTVKMFKVNELSIYRLNYWPKVFRSLAGPYEKCKIIIICHKYNISCFSYERKNCVVQTFEIFSKLKTKLYVTQNAAAAYQKN